MSSSSSSTLVCSKYHLKFRPSASTDEITFRSGDGVLFCIHRKYLETHTESFPGHEILVRPDEIVDLPESGEVLAIIFDLVYPRKQPDIEEMAFELVIHVAEAVEKYQIFSAMKACEFRLRQLIQTHPTEIMAYGIKHGYPALIKGALPRLARKPLVEVLTLLPPHHHLAWCKYHQTWSKVFRGTITFCTVNFPTSHLRAVITQIFKWEDLTDLTDLERSLHQVLEQRDYRHPETGSRRTGAYIQQAAQVCLREIRAMPKFSLL